VITVHPEWNLIFFVTEDRTIIAYDMHNRILHVIPARVFGRRSVLIEYMRPYYLPYILLFSESLVEE
jgi:hypothetical protein